MQLVEIKACLGKVVAELAKSDHIQAAVLLHPAMVTVDDIKGIYSTFLTVSDIILPMKTCNRNELHSPVTHYLFLSEIVM